MKLYEIPWTTKIRVLENVVVPPGAFEVLKGTELLFYTIDGVYSHCRTIDTNKPVYIGASTEIEIIK